MAIPQEEYLQLTSVQQARQPLTQQFYNLEKRYQEGEYITEPYKRLINQSETLDEMKNLKEKMRQGIMVSTPKPYQTRAKTLFQNLEPFIKFNERGEIFDDKGDVIADSRLEDLVQYAVRDRRRNIRPVAWDMFKSFLRKYNIPKFVLNHETLKEMETPIIKSEPTSGRSSPIVKFPSPQKRERGAKRRAKESMQRKSKAKKVFKNSDLSFLKDFKL
ncbi:MAG: hypothetical protein AAGK05_00115 [Pseudomonadota bacterium]